MLTLKSEDITTLKTPICLAKYILKYILENIKLLFPYLIPLYNCSLFLTLFFLIFYFIFSCSMDFTLSPIVLHFQNYRQNQSYFLGALVFPDT